MARLEDEEKARIVERIYREVLPIVQRMAGKSGLGSAEQWEIVQELGVVLLQKIAEHDPAKGVLRAWAIGIARNLILNERRTLRTARRRAESDSSLPLVHAPEPTPERTAHARAALDLMKAAVREDCRDVLELHAQGFTAAEIGRLLELSPSAVEHKIRQARADLSRALAKLADDDDVKGLRGVVVPFATVDDVIRALREPELPKEVFDELWRSVLERARIPPPGKLAHAGRLLERSLRAVRPASHQLSTASLVVLSLGATAELALHGPAEARPLAVAETREVVPSGAENAARVPESVPVRVAGLLPSRPSRTTLSRAQPMLVNSGPPGPEARSTDPARMDESTLLQTAGSSPPERALSLAQIHAKRFPGFHAQKREAILSRALIALGRSREAAEHTAALRGSAYDQANRDSH